MLNFLNNSRKILHYYGILNSDDEFALAEEKISKLKKMLDDGLISQEDFDSKKREILTAI